MARGAAAGVGQVLYCCIAVAVIAGGAVGVTPGLRNTSVSCIVIGHAHARMAPKALVFGSFVADSGVTSRLPRHAVAIRVALRCRLPSSVTFLG